MVKLSRKKTILDNYFFSEKVQHLIDHMSECAYLMGGVLFVIGTLCIFPQPDKDGVCGAELCFEFGFPNIFGIEEEKVQDEWGNVLYDLGSLIFFIFAGGDCLDKFFKRRALEEHITRKEIIEQGLTAVGAVIFMIGACCYDPLLQPKMDKVIHINWDFWGSILFMSGCAMFAAAVFIDALAMKNTHLSFRNHLLVMVITNEVGCLLFIAGTVPYLPGFEDSKGGMRFARWTYLIGSVLFAWSAGVGLLRSISLEWQHQLYPIKIQPEWNSVLQSKILKLMSRRGVPVEEGDVEELQDILALKPPHHHEPFICGLFIEKFFKYRIEDGKGDLTDSLLTDDVDPENSDFEGQSQSGATSRKKTGRSWVKCHRRSAKR